MNTRLKELSFLLVSITANAICNALPGTESGFHRADHLFGLRTFQIRYEYLLSQTVFDGFPRSARVAYYELPSFEGERGVWAHPDKDGYLVVFSRSKVNLWQWAELDKLAENDSLDLAPQIRAIRGSKLCARSERMLPQSIGTKLEQFWIRALSGANGHPRDRGLDGVTLVFRANAPEVGSVSWDAWNPEPASLAAKMQKVALSLAQFVENGTTSELETALIEFESYQPNATVAKPEVSKN